MKEKIYTTSEAAQKLEISTKTVYRHLKQNKFENVVIKQRGQRIEYLFPESCLTLYRRKQIYKDLRKRYQADQEPQKREYHRRIVKGKHGRDKRGEGR